MLDPKEQAKQGFGAHVAREKERRDQEQTATAPEAGTRATSAELVNDRPDAGRSAGSGPSPSTGSDGSR